jgi:hypothetical protein
MKVRVLPEVGAVDVNDADDVEIVIAQDGATIWMNANGTCIARFFKVKRITISDRRVRSSGTRDGG